MGFIQLCIAVFAIGIFLLFLNKYIRWFINPLWNIRLHRPKPSEMSFFIGIVRTMTKEAFMEPQKRWFDEAKASGLRTDMIHYCIPLGTHCLMVKDAEACKKVLHLNAKYPKKVPILTNLIGKGLVTMEGGDDWKRHRRIIHPSFQTHLIKESLDSIAPRYAEMLVKYWKRSDGREIEASVHFSNCTLDILGLVSFAHDFCAMDSIKMWSDDEGQKMVPPVTDDLMQALRAQLKFSPIRLIGLSMFDRQTNLTKKAINNAADEIIDKVRLKARKSRGMSQKDETTTTAAKRISLLEFLLDAQDTDSSNSSARKTLNNEELRDELKTFLLAGHETTSTWCTWCSFVLCKYPTVQQKVYEDIMKHAPTPNDHSFPISLDLVNQMPYFHAFMKEVLRLHPPAGIIFRNTREAEMINGVRVPANTRIAIPIHLIHRDPKYWKDPDLFQPERWLKGDAGGGGDGDGDFPATHKDAFLPFSTGPRNCIGEQFAIFEAKLIMAPLIRSFRFKIAPSLRDIKFEVTSYITSKPKPNLKFCVSQRT